MGNDKNNYLNFYSKEIKIALKDTGINPKYDIENIFSTR